MYNSKTIYIKKGRSILVTTGCRYIVRQEPIIINVIEICH